MVSVYALFLYRTMFVSTNRRISLSVPPFVLYIHVVDLFICHCIYLCIMNVYMLVYWLCTESHFCLLYYEINSWNSWNSSFRWNGYQNTTHTWANCSFSSLYLSVITIHLIHVRFYSKKHGIPTKNVQVVKQMVYFCNLSDI